MKGTVKWFNEKKGQGFIRIEKHEVGEIFYVLEEEDLIFVHCSDIITEGEKVLHEGQEVTFEIGPGKVPDTRMAINVVPVKS
jgi:cold shock protein